MSLDPYHPLLSFPGNHEPAKGYQVMLRIDRLARSVIMLRLGPASISDDLEHEVI